MNMKLAMAAMAAMAATVAWTVLANPICPSCGREASTEDAKVCAHCQTMFPKARTQTVAEPAPAPAAKRTAAAAAEGDDFTGDGEAFEAFVGEFKRARRLDGVEQGAKTAKKPAVRQPNVAYFHYRNALALATLAKITDVQQRETLSASVQRSLAEVTHWDEPCPVCKGQREYIQKAPDVGQNTGRIGSRDWLKTKISCPLCKGRGVMPGYRNYARLTRYLAEGRREFDTIHQAAGDRKIGYAWVPESLAAKLTARDRAVVASTYGAPCPKCGWAGLEPCGSAGGMTGCKGEGVVKCTGMNCKSGWIETTVKGALGGGGTGRGSYNANSRQQQKEVHPCELCNGTALVVCEACAGQRLQPCKRCSGEGLAPICTRCSGTGLMNCRKCSGSGMYTPPGIKQEQVECPECRGLGEVNCQGCNGLGRKSLGF